MKGAFFGEGNFVEYGIIEERLIGNGNTMQNFAAMRKTTALLSLKTSTRRFVLH